MARFVESRNKATRSCVGCSRLQCRCPPWPALAAPSQQHPYCLGYQNSEMLEPEGHGFRITLRLPFVVMLITLFTQELSSEPMLLLEGLSLILILSSHGPKYHLAWPTEENVPPTPPLSEGLRVTSVSQTSSLNRETGEKSLLKTEEQDLLWRYADQANRAGQDEGGAQSWLTQGEWTRGARESEPPCVCLPSPTDTAYRGACLGCSLYKKNVPLSTVDLCSPLSYNCATCFSLYVDMTVLSQPSAGCEFCFPNVVSHSHIHSFSL